MRWKENETRLFVKLYASHRCLWDQEHDYYKLKYKRQDAYKDIVTKFNALTNILLDESKVAMKVKSLKSTYSQELSKIKTRAGTYKPNLRWFDDWHKCFQKRKISLNEESISGDDQLEAKNELEEESIWLDEELEDSETADLSTTDKDPRTSPTDDSYVLYLKSEPQESDNSEAPYKKRKRKIKQHNTSNEPSSSSEAKEDEFDIYGKYIATQLRNMDIEQALKVQMQIQNIVSKARINSLMKPSLHLDNSD